MVISTFSLYGNQFEEKITFHSIENMNKQENIKRKRYTIQSQIN